MAKKKERKKIRVERKITKRYESMIQTKKSLLSLLRESTETTLLRNLVAVLDISRQVIED
jgi:hypothetical protein